MDKYARRRRSLVRILVVSLCFALVTPLVIVLAFSESVDYLTPLHPATFYAMSFQEQQEWLRNNSRRNAGWVELRGRVRSPTFWTQEYIPTALGAFVLVLLSCAVFAVWDRREMRSNSTPHADARATAALDQPPSAHAGEGER
jgi:predicted PurR-regulated permease PerM